MLRYLTYKLKTQSLNEADSFPSKQDDDHDSGTESDDEGADAEELEKYMDDSLQGDVSSAPSDRASSTLDTVTDPDGGRVSSSTDCEESGVSGSGRTTATTLLLPDSALPSDSDCHHLQDAAHSSEEELEVIINGCCSDHLHHHHHRRRGGHHHHHHHHQYPEKRKWSQANTGEQRLSSLGSGSSDEEVRDLMCASAPVEFRASPPANVPKPSRSLSPPPKLFHASGACCSETLSPPSCSSANIPPHELCSVSPRKRHRRTLLTATTSTNLVLHRPCLDFEKMQQEMTE